MSRLKVLYWFDIPGQVVAKTGRRSRRYRLSGRFSKAIERAGYRIRKQGGDALFDPWRQADANTADDDIHAAAEKLVQQLEVEYDDLRLERLVRNNGCEQVVEPGATELHSEESAS